MIGRRARVALTALPLIASAPLAAQDWSEVTFGGDLFDVSGAGTLELGNIDPVLKPFRREFAGRYDLKLVLTVDAKGTITDCRDRSGKPLSKAGAAFCAHARAVGRFRVDPWLVLEYSSATYQLTIFRRDRRGKGDSEFGILEAYPYERSAIQFGEFVVPPEDQRLTLSDVRYAPMEYPSFALQTHIEARVMAVLGFNESGKVESCRPVSSSNTARIAYETCAQARNNFRLTRPPDARPFVVVANWRIGDAD